MSAQSVAARSRATRRHRHDEEEAHENHERWLITYSDMITLLMVLFIVLFSIGQTDLEKFRRLSAGLAESFGNDSGLLASGASLLDDPVTAIPEELPSGAEDALAAREAAREAIAKDQHILQSTKETLEQRLSAVGVEDAVDLQVEPRGLIVTIVTDDVLFEPGSATVLPAGREILEPIATALADLPNRISVEGHTDSVPIHTARFPSNWELSTARATNVLRLLRDVAGLPPDRLAAAGYADTRPVGDNSTAAGRAANRRVEIVVHSLVDDAGLVADVAGTGTPPTTIAPIPDPIQDAS